MSDVMSSEARGGRRWRPVVVVALAAAIGATGIAVAQADRTPRRPDVPRSTEVETATGVQVVRVTLAADSGLLDVRYRVLDPTKARRWLGDTTKPPQLHDQRNSALLGEVAPMRESHEQRAGQTYYLIYHNTHNEVHRGDLIDLTVAGVTLHDVPVE